MLFSIVQWTLPTRGYPYKSLAWDSSAPWGLRTRVICLSCLVLYNGPLSPPQADWEDEEDENNYASSQPRVLRRRNSEYPGKEKTQSERKNIKELKNCKHENLKI